MVFGDRPMIENKQILFVISSLEAGGAERVISILANYFVRNRYTVTIVTYLSKNRDWYRLDSRIVRIEIGHFHNRSKIDFINNNILRMYKLRMIIRKCNPDVVISFLTEVNVLVLLATINLGIKTIVSERVDPTMHHELLSIFKWLRRAMYPWASTLVVQTQSIANYYSKWSGVKIKVIPNPAIVPIVTHGNNVNIHKPCIVALGRLSEQKGFDLLIKSFSKIAQKYPEWNVIIIGEGEKKKELLDLVHHLKLTNRVSLIGRVKNSYSILQKADIFVLSSRYEGFPNALLEAMASGLPVVSFNCPSGPAEIIIDNYNGMLVPPGDIQKLSRAIETLIHNKSLRQKLGRNARKITARFSEEKIVSQWERLF